MQKFRYLEAIFMHFVPIFTLFSPKNALFSAFIY